MPETGAVPAGAAWAMESPPQFRRMRGIEEGIEQVDEQIDEDEDRGDQQHEALDQREVAARRRIDEQLADAVEVEHLLGDDEAADQEGELEADHGDDRQQRVAQGVPAR